MVDIVVLGVAGVLQPVAAVWEAEIAAAVAGLGREALGAADFEPRAWSRLRRREPAALARTIRDHVPHWPQTRVRALLRSLRDVVPDTGGARSRERLQVLRSGCRLAFLDQGSPVRMDPWLERLAGDGERRLWTDALGGQARPPRPLAFRWLAERLDLRPSECLYVPGTPLLRKAALAAGWRVWGEPPADATACADLEALAAALADGDLE